MLLGERVPEAELENSFYQAYRNHSPGYPMECAAMMDAWKRIKAGRGPTFRHRDHCSFCIAHDADPVVNLCPYHQQCMTVIMKKRCTLPTNHEGDHEFHFATPEEGTGYVSKRICRHPLTEGDANIEFCDRPAGHKGTHFNRVTEDKVVKEVTGYMKKRFIPGGVPFKEEQCQTTSVGPLGATLLECELVAGHPGEHLFVEKEGVPETEVDELDDPIIVVPQGEKK